METKGFFVWKQVLLFLCVLWGTALRLQAQGGVSLFATGRWFKVAVTEKGVYRIDASLLRQAGLDLGAVSPLEMELYGQPGGMLPQPLSDTYPQQLQPHAIYLQANENSQWDEDEYLLFYAESPDSYTYSPSETRYEYQKNLYSDTLYYFLALKGGQGRRITARPSPQGSASETLRHYEAYYAHEIEERNLLRSGRRWYGELFSANSLEQEFTLPLRPVVGRPIVLQSAAAASCDAACTLEVSLQGQSIGTHSFSAITRAPYARIGWHDVQLLTADTRQVPLSLQYRFNAGGEVASLSRLLLCASHSRAALWQPRAALFSSQKGLG